MFEVPHAKRIKRSELFHGDDSSPSPSRSTSPAGVNYEQDDTTPSKPDYGFDYDFISPSSAPAPPLEAKSTQKEETSNEDNKEEEYNFRLFTSSTPRQSAQPIRLSPTPPPTNPTEPPSLDEANFIRPHRPDSYYFTSALPQGSIQTLKSEYATVAVSTSDVLNFATSTKWPGTALPWRCIHVHLVNPTKTLSRGRTHDALSQIKSGTDTKRTGRPSKKRRILLRKRLAQRANLAAQAQQSEEAEREKRTRRNREKKVKRKEREKRKKSMGSEAGQSTAADHGPMAGDEDHSMLDGNMDVDLPDARTAVDTATATAKPTATVEEEQSPRTNATKEERSNEVVPKASQAGVRPDEAGLKAPGAVAPPKAVTKSVPPTARRAPPTSRAPTARAAVL